MTRTQSSALTRETIKITLAATCVLLGAACGEDPPRAPGDGGMDRGIIDRSIVDGPRGDAPRDGEAGADALAVAAVSPAVGPVAGGTAVEISGSGFADGATISFGERAGTDVVLVSAVLLRAKTPAADGPGKVDVTVALPGGERATLAAAYEYQQSAPAAVDYCVLHSPPTLVAQPGAASAPVFGRVWEQGCSEGAKRCATVQGQLGYGPRTADPSQSPTSFSWVAASYNPSHTADDNDEYQATLNVPAAGDYGYAYRFSVDGGASWTYCDLDGSGNGFAADKMGQLTAADAAVTVGWCAVQWPPSTIAQPGQPSESIFGQVFAAGCSEGAAHCDKLDAELGLGPAGADPVSNPAQFTWVAATYNAAHTDDDNDEYGATLTAATAGSYAYAYRFSADGGTTWSYCDLDGSGNGFDAAQMGRLAVGTPQVDWCALQHPPQSATAPGVASEPIYGRVLVAGCSEGTAQCAEVSGQLGYGDPATDPAQSPGDYTWVDASPNVGHTSDDNDEFVATITPTAKGSFGYAYRFSRDGGTTWKYCDLDGSGNGFDLAQLGQLTVPPAAAGVQWCNTQWPATTTAAPGAPGEPIFGQVYVAGCTDGAAQCAQVTAQLGYGDPAKDASQSPGDYTWVDAAYNGGHTANDNDEYMTTLTVASAGSYAYAYRFSTDGGATWSYCDRDGSANGYDQAAAGALTVAAAALSIGWCNLQSPASTATAQATPSEVIYGRVLVAGCTEGAAQCAQVTAQVGYGSATANPAQAPGSYVWFDAAYNPGHTADDNDEHMATLTPASVGSYAYAFRFSVDGGATWSYCDRDGSDNGLQLDQLGALGVGAATVASCTLKHPPATSTAVGAPSEAIYGRATVPGCTDGAARCASLKGQLGYGAAAVDPSADPASYTWVDGGYNAGHTSDDQDEHGAKIVPTAAGSFAYAYRFSNDGGATWTYCDLDGSDNGFDVAQRGSLSVTTRTVEWCNVQSPASVTVTAGASTGAIYGRVYVPGCTDGQSFCQGLVAELGHGPAGADPSASPGDYTWLPATYNAGHTSDDNDEYEAAFTPAQAGSFGYAYRFSGDGGATWSYCDTTGDAFAASDVGQLTVQ